jgi:nicotinate-nucleotide adenylyltransferase
MEFFVRANTAPCHLGILAGAFNPVTLAHLGLAQAALHAVDEVVFVLPRIFPHKTYGGAPFEERIAMLQEALAGEPRFSIAATSRGLFREIAAECRLAYGAGTRLSFLCGRDAAERIVNWDYGEPNAIAGMLREFSLLVAARDGQYVAPRELADSVFHLPVSGACDGISATEVRRRIAAGEDWEALVPPAIHSRARRLYGPPTGRPPGSKQYC